MHVGVTLVGLVIFLSGQPITLAEHASQVTSDICSASQRMMHLEQSSPLLAVKQQLNKFLNACNKTWAYSLTLSFLGI